MATASKPNIFDGSEVFPPEHMPIRLRVLNIMNDIGLLEKGGTAPEILGKFKFMSSDAVKAALHPSLMKWGVVFSIDVEDATVQFMENPKGTTIFTMVKVRCSMTAMNDPAETISGVAFGQGMDKQDKGMGKAITAAVKSWLNHTLTLQGDIDIESESVDTNGSSGTSKAKKSNNAPVDYGQPKDHKYDELTRDEAIKWCVNRWALMLSDGDAFKSHLLAHDSTWTSREAVPMPYLLNHLRKCERILGVWNQVQEAAAACGVTRQELADRVSDSKIPLPEWDEDTLAFWLEELSQRMEQTSAQNATADQVGK